MWADIGVHFSALGGGGGTLVVVAVGTDAYGATHDEPLTALHAAACKAAEGLALRGMTVDPKIIVERGQEELSARARRSASPELPKPPPAR